MNLLFRTGLFLLLGLCLAQAQTCDTLISEGRAFLTASNLVSANARFANAVALCPEDPTANTLYAVTRLAVLPQTLTISNFLNRLGLPVHGRSIYEWLAEPPRDATGAWVAPTGVNASEFAAVIHTNLLPTLVAAQANLAKVTQTSFLLSLSRSETKMADLTVDYGDVQLLRAMLRTLEYWCYTVYSWNLDVQLSSLRTLYDSDLLSLQSVLQNNPGLLTFSTTDDLQAARQAFTNAVARYLDGSAFIRSRPGNINRLFMYDFSRAQDEENFRRVLTDLNASLQSPAPLSTDTNYTLSFAKHFEGLTPLRSLLPAFHENSVLAGTLPDPTFGGIITTGLTQTAVESLLSEHVQVRTFMTNATVTGNEVAFDFNTIPGQAYGLEFSYNLQDWSPLYQFSATSNSVHFVEDLDSSGIRFYRLAHLGKYIVVQGKVLDGCSLQPLAGAVVRTSLDFASAVTGADGRFTLETQTPEGVPLAFDVTAEAPGHHPATISVFDSSSVTRDLLAFPLITSIPVNDDFANRIPLSGAPASSRSSSCGSTVQTNEPGLPVGGTAWWSWTSPHSGLVRITASGAYAGQYLLRLYSGTTLDNLVLLTNDLASVVFPAVAGQTYQICVEDAFNTGAAITLSIAFPPVLDVASPANGANFPAPANIPIRATATASGNAIQEVRFYLNDELVHIDSISPYELDWVNTLPGEYFFTIVATDERGLSTTDSRFVTVRPPNDDFANRTILLGTNLAVTANNFFATLELGEPAHGDSACCSVWWTWTAPYSGFVTLKAIGQPPYGENATFLSVYTGTTLPSLEPVANGVVQGGDLSSQVSFPTVAGTAYQIAVAGYYLGDDVTLLLQPSAAPLVTLTEPPTEILFWGPTNLTVSAEAEDPDGAIARIEFYANSRLFATASNAPYTVVWSNVVAGYYDLQAKAIDDTGVVTWSGKILVPVGAINDHFDNRIVLSGTNTLAFGSNEGTSREHLEPRLQERESFQTAWWEWTAPRSGLVTVRVNGPANSYPLLGVFTGPFVYALTEVTSAASDSTGDYGSCTVTFLATEGTSYKLTVASEFSTSFAFTLGLTMP